MKNDETINDENSIHRYLAETKPADRDFMIEDPKRIAWNEWYKALFGEMTQAGRDRLTAWGLSSLSDYGNRTNDRIDVLEARIAELEQTARLGSRVDARGVVIPKAAK